MEFKGTQKIMAPRAAVWRSLNDPAMLQACVPGCTAFTASGDDEFQAVVVASVGPVKATFKGNLTLSDRIEDTSYRIVGKGEGGIAGFGKMTAFVALEDDGEAGATLLTYTSNAEVGGKLAQIGSRLVSSVANKLADEFFKRFNSNVSALAGKDASAA
jgi:carbon monoxide dehydrogenase subunit G